MRIFLLTDYPRFFFHRRVFPLPTSAFLISSPSPSNFHFRLSPLIRSAPASLTAALAAFTVYPPASRLGVFYFPLSPFPFDSLRSGFAHRCPRGFHRLSAGLPARRILLSTFAFPL